MWCSPAPESRAPRLSADETALIRAAQAGDREAFEQLVRAYDHSVLRLAMNMLRSPEDARDVYQETFLRVYRNLTTSASIAVFTPGSTASRPTSAWICCASAKFVKKNRRCSRRADGTVDRFESVAEQSAELDPQRHLLSGQIRTRVKDALAQLSPRERTVFEMRHYEGLRLRNIGEVLGTTEEAAKNCLFRATQKMRAALGDFV